MKLTLISILLSTTLGRKCWSRSTDQTTTVISTTTAAPITTGNPGSSTVKCTKRPASTTELPGATGSSSTIINHPTDTSIVGDTPSTGSVTQTIPSTHGDVIQLPTPPPSSSSSYVVSSTTPVSIPSSTPIFSSTLVSSSIERRSSSYPIYRPSSSYPIYQPSSSYPVNRPSSSYPVSRPSSSYPASRPSSASSSRQPSSTPLPDAGTSKLQGITYSPYADNGLCHDTETVYRQLSHVVKLTTNIRLFGADCNQVSNVLDALVKLNAQGQVLLGIWLRGGDQRYGQELDIVTKALQNPRYRSLISGVAVGNEEMFNGATSASVAGKIRSVRAHLSNFGVNVPVSTVESYKFWDNTLIEASDVIYSTIYPYYTPSHGDGTIITAVKGAFTELAILRARLPPNKPLVIGETGWPTSGTAANTFALPTLADQQRYVAHFQCLARKINLPVYYLEAYDARWKSGASAEQHFGLLEPNGNLKGGLGLTNLLAPIQC